MGLFCQLRLCIVGCRRILLCSFDGALSFLYTLFYANDADTVYIAHILVQRRNHLTATDDFVLGCFRYKEYIRPSKKVLQRVKGYSVLSSAPISCPVACLWENISTVSVVVRKRRRISEKSAIFVSIEAVPRKIAY